MALLLVGSLICGAFAHGRMTDPPSRNHQAQDGGKNSLWSETNRCGSNGGTKKHYDQWATKKFNVEKTLTAGQIFTVSLEITAPHVGKQWFEFACMDGMLDLITGHKDVSWTKVEFANGKTETARGVCQSKGTCTFKIRVPEVNCKHGVLNWNWMAVHNTPREWFRNCADVQITGRSETRPVTTTTASSPPVATTTAASPPVATTAASSPAAVTNAAPSPAAVTTAAPTTNIRSKTSDMLDYGTIIGVIVGIVVLALFCSLCFVVAKKRDARVSAETMREIEAEKAKRDIKAEKKRKSRNAKTKRGLSRDAKE
eukprot:GEMP01039249.1.p1 GENE.GEMP01039249.1~~GEMP01039249.1.p1  ORF type:complete len:313 (+),score=70.82 GEMP01039249.1:123-1061(+)